MKYGSATTSAMLPDMSKLALRQAPTSPKWKAGQAWPDDFFDDAGRARKDGRGPDGRVYRKGEFHPYRKPFSRGRDHYASGNYPFYNPNDPNLDRYAAERAAERSAQENEAARRSTDRVLRVRRTGDALAEGQLWGEAYSAFWIRHYDEDRAYHKTLARNHPHVDYHRNKTPPRRRQVEYDIQLSRPPGSDPTAPPPTAKAHRWEYIADSVMDPAEYANWRRGYEEDFIRRERERIQRKANPRAVIGGARVDRVSPLDTGTNYHRFDKMPELYYYYSATGGHVLRLDNPLNFPDPAIEAARIAAEQAAAAAAAQLVADQQAAAAAAAEAQREANRQAAEVQLVDLARQESQERERQRVAWVGVPMDAAGRLHDSHRVLPLPDRYAGVFYHSICILRGLDPNVPEVVLPGGIQEMYPVNRLRKKAMAWLNERPSAGTFITPEMQVRESLLRTDNSFRQYLAGDAGPEVQRDYTLGMPRAMRQINEWRTRVKGWRVFEDWAHPIDGPPPPPNATDEEVREWRKAYLLVGYTNAQIRPSAWATLYDVEALAWSLPEQRPIHLYGVSGSQDDTGAYRQNWHLTVPLHFGPPLRAGDQPYRLLCTFDDTMRFRPLVFKGDSPERSPLPKAAQLARSPQCIESKSFARDDVDPVDVADGVYSVDPWAGQHRADPADWQ